MKIWPKFNNNLGENLLFQKTMGQDGVVWISREQTQEAKLIFESQIKEKHQLQIGKWDVVEDGLELVPKYLKSICRDTNQYFEKTISVIFKNQSDTVYETKL